MKEQNCLGIYVTEDSATVVCLRSGAGDRSVVACFTVAASQPAPQGAEGQKLDELARLIAQGCAARDLKFTEVAVALDCAMFMQHRVHSEFTDARQIAATIRFDVEESLAINISDIALAYKIDSVGEAGSELEVFTARQKVLSEILTALQQNNIDPIAVEPDVSCLLRFVSHRMGPGEGSPDGSQDLRAMFCILSHRRGYLLDFARPQQPRAARTFLISPSQNRTALLAREIPITAALVDSREPINSIRAFDAAGSIQPELVSKSVGVETELVDIAQAAGCEAQALADCPDVVDFAIAYGAALWHTEKTRGLNFREDFMPYQGKKERLQKTMKFVGISATVLMLAVGFYFHLQLLQTNKERSGLRAKFQKDYSAVMFGQNLPDKLSAVNKLKGEVRRIENIKSGLFSVTGEESVSAKLTMILEAFNSCAEQVGLNIDSISVTTKAISIAGDTSSSRNTLKLFDAIKAAKMDVLQQRIEQKGDRNNFRITVEIKK